MSRILLFALVLLLLILCCKDISFIHAEEKDTSSHALLKMTSNSASSTIMNLFSNSVKKRNTEQCSCASCLCDGETCPYSIGAGSSHVRVNTCGSDEYLGSLSVNVASTDSSSYSIYTMTRSEYTKYQQGGTFYYYSSLSAESATCVYLQSSLTDTSVNELVTVMKCKNLVYSCPTRFYISGTCKKLQSTTVSYIKMEYNSDSINSGSQISGTVKAYDSAGNVAPISNNYITFTSESSGSTLQGTTSVSLNNGVANFAFTVTNSISSDVLLKASKWNTQPGCNPSTCCCLDGQVTVTRSGLNLVQLTSNVKGSCGTTTSVTIYIGSIDSYDTVSAVGGGNPYTLKKSGTTIQMTNHVNNACSGSAVCTDACPRSKDSTKTNHASKLSNVQSLVVVVVGMISLLFILVL
ncbi:hypothetical protein C9374_006404 [Naegleria lovaniensis]|uniref:Uncharacterized protein n=1 Tax=Naegleria lovaniensis TaxID=51637 RepID=A0AA88GJR1_NAELO|nr:uncharacterized protein C9374_006404 [Naegleria lovaniensis]KAG2381415.1 hypothetical protein C9374_006404 [Naegleria lovaniensis]